MSVNMQQIETMIERFAPLRYACDWDNSGFNINLGGTADKILICLDATMEVIEEAASKGCSLIVSHHPLFFKPVNKIDAEKHEGKIATALISRGISLYCAHTSMDSSPDGINTYLGAQLGLENIRFIENMARKEYDQIGVYVPLGYENAITQTMGEAGAGLLGNYRDCSWLTQGTGQFMPLAGAQPFIGKTGKMENVEESKIETICDSSLTKNVICEMKAAHPYEEVSYYTLPLKDPKTVVAGLGIIGDFTEELTLRQIADRVKEKLSIDSIRVAGDLNKIIKKAGVCGGSGGDLIAGAKHMGAQVFITGEVKHNFYVSETDIAIIEAGHYDTEKCFVQLFVQGLQKQANELQYNLSIYVSENVERSFSNY